LKIEIQARDIQIMKFVFACRVVTYDQIIRRHFPKIHINVARRRIRKLADCGYFKVSALLIGGQVLRIVQPLPAMWPLISERWPLVVDSPLYKSESLEHDVRMAELFMRLEKLNCYRSFFTENLLQSSSALAQDPRFCDLTKIQADGALTIVDAKENLRIYGVEFELSKKSPEGYRQKLLDYHLAKGIDGVLYISPERQIHALLARVEEEICNEREPFVWRIFEENALKPSEKIIFHNRLEQTLEFT
jgi:hypothetical protein